MSSASEEESLHGEDDHEEETKAGTVTAAVLRPSQLIDATELEGGAAAAVAAGTAAASSAPPSPKISDKAAKVPPAKATRRPTKSRRKQKASNMPSRPLSAFNFFMRETKDDWLEKNRPTHDPSEGSLFAAMTKAIAQHWKNLPSDEAEKYHQMAAHDSQRYKDEMEQYNTAEARMRRLAEGNAKMQARGPEDSSGHTTIVSPHALGGESVASSDRGRHRGPDPLLGSFRESAMMASSQGQFPTGRFNPLSSGNPFGLGLESAGSLVASDPFLLGGSLNPWSQQAATTAAAGSGISGQSELLQQYLIEQRLQQRLVAEQRFLAEQQRMIEQRALEQVLLEQRLRSLQGGAGAGDGMYASDPMLASALAGMPSSNLPFGGLGFTGSFAGSGSLGSYPPVANPALASLGGFAGASSARAPTNEILNSVGLGSANQDQGLGGRPKPWTNPFSCLPGGTDATGPAGVGIGASFGLQSAAATEASRRLVRNLLHPSPAGTRDGTDASEDSRGNTASGGEF